MLALSDFSLSLLENMSDGFLSVDAEWTITYINARGACLIRRSPAEVQGKQLWGEFPVAVGSAFYYQYRHVKETGGQAEFDAYYPPLDSWFEVRVYHYKGGINIIFRDITTGREREQALRKYNRQLEELLRERTEQHRQADERFIKIFRVNPTAMCINDLNDGRYIDVNDSFLTLTGFGRWEVLGKKPSELNIWVSKADMAEAWSAMQSRKPIQNLEVSFRTRADEVRVGLLSAVYITVEGRDCVLSVTTDITELRRYERELLRLDRLNLVGQMAAGIGHEVRNPMTTVRGYLQMLRGKEQLADYANQFNIMIDELDRANQIITEFLSLARNKTNDRRLLDINDLIGSLLPLIQADALEAGRTFTSWLGAVDLVCADAKEINQLLLNLIRNAIEATERNGKIILETYQTGSRVMVAVENNGPPIPPQILEALGTPFFTTKENGTGLGLPICYSIAARNNAEIRVLSVEGCTRFEVVFSVAGYMASTTPHEIAYAGRC